MNGYLPAVEMAPRNNNKQAAVVLEEGRKINRTKLHQLLGHLLEDKLRTTAKAMNWELTGQIEKCEDCALSKARQKNVAKATKPRSEIKGERLFIDIAPMKYKSLGGSRYWLIVLDDNTNYVWSYFFKEEK